MKGEGKGNVCVTGAGGFIASWLVKILLSNGYKVHGTVRDSGDPKNAHLHTFAEAPQNLELFNADLLDYTSLAAAIAGCEGVFHVASPIPKGTVLDPQLELINPAIEGTMNVLKACSEAKVQRLVLVSSVAAVNYNPNWPSDRVQDEDCWSDREFCIKIKNWYCLSKILAEEAAWSYANKNGLDLITVCPSVVVGPLLQPTVNISSMYLLYVIKGGPDQLMNIVWNFVDVRDVAEALLLVYEKPEASGRYICAPHTCNVKDMIGMLKRKYPQYDYHSELIEVEPSPAMSAEKLKALGWRCRTLEEVFTDAIEYYQKAGLLDEHEGHSIHLPPFLKP